jgi:hypothetical protein
MPEKIKAAIDADIADAEALLESHGIEACKARALAMLSLIKAKKLRRPVSSKTLFEVYDWALLDEAITPAKNSNRFAAGLKDEPEC